MPTETIAGHTVEVDEQGYLLDADAWNEDIAHALAARNKLTLTDRHWTVIRFCRKDAAEQGEPPGVRRITRNTDVTMREMYLLFPMGPGKLAALIAGIPKPDRCV